MASMRPGQAAPDETDIFALLPPKELASMRPGQAAPDEHLPLDGQHGLKVGFNEAGASSPG